MRGWRVFAVVLVASLAMAMAACGEDDDPVTVTGGAQSSAPTVAAAVTTTAAPKATVATAGSSLGTIFVDGAGRTLYTWDRDSGGQSSCTGSCAATWPPLVLPAGVTAPVAGTGVSLLTTVPRPDDATKLQVVWDGKPLYYYAGDTAPGDVKGDGVGGTWHVVKQPY
jgi:predicted lipoprotein with Yx(FWY)xxD motif